MGSPSRGAEIGARSVLLPTEPDPGHAGGGTMV